MRKQEEGVVHSLERGAAGLDKEVRRCVTLAPRSEWVWLYMYDRELERRASVGEQPRSNLRGHASIPKASPLDLAQHALFGSFAAS